MKNSDCEELKQEIRALREDLEAKLLRDLERRIRRQDESQDEDEADQATEGPIAWLLQSSNLAAETLRRNLTCGHPPTEVKAATEILDTTFAFLTAEYLLRLDRVEERLTARAVRKTK